jgi:hypothetical protein
MWPQSWIKGKEDVLRELKHWEGAKAQAWAYSVSHGQFLVRLYREEGHQKHESPSSLYMYLKVCDRVEFDSLWRDAHIHIDEKKGEHGPEFIVSDGNRLSITCGAVFATVSQEFVRFEPPTI